MVVRLVGGLGNQMFQYAFGRSLSIARGESLYFDTSVLGWRTYGLGAFNVDVQIGHMSKSVYEERMFCYDPGAVTAPPGTYFKGYWQTEKYFNVEVLRREFSLRNPVSEQTAKVADAIRSAENSAFIHVRRTDYLSPNTAAYHGNMGMDYYVSAMAHIRERAPGIRFFVFSDDTAWCRENFADCQIVDHNKNGKEHEDLFLMSLCNHAIAANSSFSWWGAWLGDGAPGRIVIVPAKWFLADLDTKDLVPERWLRIDQNG
jgi:hypothetical protein